MTTLDHSELLIDESHPPYPDAEEESEALSSAIVLLGEIMRGEVNPEDEAEKWLRSYGHLTKTSHANPAKS